MHAPKMKTKASEGRKLLFCVRFILQHYFPARTHHAEVRYACVDQLCRMYEALERWDEGDADTARLCGTRALMAYAELYQAIQ